MWDGCVGLPMAKKLKIHPFGVLATAFDDFMLCVSLESFAQAVTWQ